VYAPGASPRTPYAVWPGEFSSGLFVIDDLDEYATAFGIIHDEERTGLTDHRHDVRWRPASWEDKPHAPIAVGVNAHGHREVLGIDVAAAEDGAGRIAFPRSPGAEVSREHVVRAGVDAQFPSAPDGTAPRVSTASPAPSVPGITAARVPRRTKPPPACGPWPTRARSQDHGQGVRPSTETTARPRDAALMINKRNRRRSHRVRTTVAKGQDQQSVHAR
jgi:hypothetical protein